MPFKLFMHHIDFCYIFLRANLQSTLGFFLLCFCSFALCFGPYPSTMPRKTRTHRTPSTSSKSPSRSEVFRNDKCKEAFDTLNSKRKIWAERAVVLDEIDPVIRANFGSRGWLPLLEIDHPPPTALIREFFSNLSCHVYDSNTLLRSWIRGVEFTIIPRVVVEALGFRLFRSLTIPMMSLLP